MSSPTTSLGRYWKWVVCPLIFDNDYGWPHKIRNPFRLWKWQRLFRCTGQMLRWGWCDVDCWSLDNTITDFILPRLVFFREHYAQRSNPMDMTNEQWCETIDKMIYSFERIQIDDGTEDYERVQEGLNLFGEWLQALWD